MIKIIKTKEEFEALTGKSIVFVSLVGWDRQDIHHMVPDHNGTYQWNYNKIPNFERKDGTLNNYE